uniref:Uncharacterized protein n=1 Tax=Knipowitschia caucasica TaxID=637954 RepID=A0AAV2JUH7_KNICA
MRVFDAQWILQCSVLTIEQRNQKRELAEDSRKQSTGHQTRYRPGIRTWNVDSTEVPTQSRPRHVSRQTDRLRQNVHDTDVTGHGTVTDIDPTRHEEKGAAEHRQSTEQGRQTTPQGVQDTENLRGSVFAPLSRVDHL